MNDIRFLNGMINSTFHQAASKFHLTDSEMSILYVLNRCGEGCNQCEIYKSTGMRKSTIISAIHKMEREGLLYLKKGQGRNKKVYLTDEGRKRSQESIEVLLKLENEIFNELNIEERKSFIDLTNRFFMSLNDEINKL